MSARFWKWRLHGGAVTMARKALQAVADGFKPDVILASSMVNVPAFLALTRAELSGVPVAFYLHENQLTYPLRPDEKRDLAYGYVNYLSCLASDRVVFNSEFHYDEFMRALPGLLRTFPDYTHLATVQEIRAKSSVLHLGMDLQAHDQFALDYSDHAWGPSMPPPIVLWNQRWEYDKDPEAFFRVMNRLDDANCRFRLILAGKHFEEQPYHFEEAFERYAERILHYGYCGELRGIQPAAPPGRYRRVYRAPRVLRHRHDGGHILRLPSPASRPPKLPGAYSRSPSSPAFARARAVRGL